MNNEKNSVPLYLRFWGKTGEDGSYHLLPYHCMDVAAVGWILMHPENSLCRRLAEQLKVDAAWLRHWFVFCLMLHDIGKFARAFQNLVSDLSPELVPYRGQCIYQLRHEFLGYLFSRVYLDNAFGKGEVSEGLVRLAGEKS